MKRQVAALCSMTAVLSVLTGVAAGAAQTTGSVSLSSGTAFGPITNSGNCSGANAAELAARTAADALDDDWFTTSGRDTVSIGLFPDADTGSIGNDYTLAFPGTSITVEIAKYNIAAADAASTAAGSYGTIDIAGGTDPQLANSSAERLQDCAPKPLSLVSTAEAGPLASPTPYWNPTGFSGDASTLDSVLFTFSQPVSDFGAWFGDLETRTPDATTDPDDGGRLGYVKLYAADGSVLAVEPITPTVQTAVTNDAFPPGDPLFDNEGFGCGDKDTGNDASACGNHGTRFIGFNWPTASVAAIQVIVGDDDHCGISPCDGLIENLSFIGPQLALDAPQLLLVKEVVNDDGGALGPADFTILVAEDPTGANIVAEHTSGDIVELTAGTEYAIREPIPTGYSLQSLACVDDVSGATLPPIFTPTGLGQTITCTLINNDVAPATTTTTAPTTSTSESSTSTTSSSGTSSTMDSVSSTSTSVATTATSAPAAPTTVSPAANTVSTANTISTANTVGTAQAAAAMPNTGCSTGPLAAVAFGLLGAGLILLDLSRRRIKP